MARESNSEVQIYFGGIAAIQSAVIIQLLQLQSLNQKC